MPMRRFHRLMFATTMTVLLVLAAHAAAPDTSPAFSSDQVAFYEKEVRPLLTQHCLKCHGAEAKVKGGLNLATRQAVLTGGDSGPAADLKSPTTSLLLKAIAYTDENHRMPPKGKLAEADIAVLTKWVTEGLPFPANQLGETIARDSSKPLNGTITEDAKKYWAYQPIRRPAVPQVNAVAHPIDAFIRAKLEAKNLKPVKPADKIALVRRAYYDLWGLPPAPEQVDAFVKDASPGAWEKLIDQLLASPHYGEKWGRYWLDVVRFAETNGYERDGPKPFAWRYRDYVIKSFNEDKPYDQFIREQLAGDEMQGENREAIIATGFHRLGLWDDEPADALQSLFDGYDDLVTVTGQAFLGMTLNCARCHDHKVDPILQADYYRMVAFFRDIRPYSETRDVRSRFNLTDITPPEKRKEYEDALKIQQARLAMLEQSMIAMENAAIRKMPAEDQRAAEGGERRRIVAKVPRTLGVWMRMAYLTMKQERTRLEKNLPAGREFALSVNGCDVQPPPVFVLPRGNPHAKGNEVAPGFPTVIGTANPILPAVTAKSSGRRTVLANWVASKDNPLTARVMVNRIWQGHFGRGLVPTSNDFGKLGELPTHPELLDWLAAEFVVPTRGGSSWTTKRLHKLIMTSETYRLSSTSDEANLRADPANTLLWRFNMRRLNAEEVRDSILAVSGKLNPKMCGPSVYPRLSAEVLAGISFPDKETHWPRSTPEEANRRSVYVFVKRSLQVPVLATHDQADTDNSCPVRYTTTVPTQALGLLNGEFANESAAAFAVRLSQESPGDVRKQVARAIRLTMGRVPTADEIAKDVAFINGLKAKHRLDDAAALTQFCLMLLNTNEFVYLD